MLIPYLYSAVSQQEKWSVKPADIMMEMLTVVDREGRLNEIMGQQLAVFVTGNTECHSACFTPVLSTNIPLFLSDLTLQQAVPLHVQIRSE